MQSLLLRLIVVASLSATTHSAYAALRIFACEPEWAALAAELTPPDTEIFSATTALQDPHRIEARPSLIAKLRRADLLICSGAELESGWLPMLLRQAGNGKVQPGQEGNFEAAMQVERLDIPTQVDRSLGDVHAAGNPHVHLDPRRITQIAAALNMRLQQIDPANASRYASRHTDFTAHWQQSLQRWDQMSQPLRGLRVVTQHQGWSYLFAWLGIIEVGQLEPKPGLPPAAGHIAALKAQLAEKPVRVVIYASYQDGRAAEWLARQNDLPLLMLPFTVGGSEQAQSLTTLFDDILEQLLRAAP